MNTKIGEKTTGKAPAELLADQISKLGDWRGEQLAQLRKIILASDPDLVEEWKWGTIAWSHSGMVCSAVAFKDHVRLNFFKGAALQDPENIFNTGLDAKESRGIDFSEGVEIPEKGLKELIQRAVAYNLAMGKRGQ